MIGKTLKLLLPWLYLLALFPIPLAAQPGTPSGSFHGIFAGNTTWDAQRHGSMQRQIEYQPGSQFVHVNWAMLDVFGPPPNNSAQYNCYDWTIPGWVANTHPWGGDPVSPAGQDAAYTALEVNSAGNAVLVHHADIGGGVFTKVCRFAIPGLLVYLTDNLANLPGTRLGYPRTDIGQDINGDVYHVGSMDCLPGIGNLSSLVYWRYVDLGGGTYVWQGPVVMDAARTPSQVLLADGQRTIFAFSRPRTAATDEFDNDLVYYESLTAGEDWILAGGPVIPWNMGGGWNTTDYVDEDPHRCFVDIAGGFDSEGRLHLVYTNPGYDPVGPVSTPQCDLLHWHEGTPGSNDNAVVSGSAPGGFVGGQDAFWHTVSRATSWTCAGSPGVWNRYISKPGIAFGDGSTLCGGNSNLDYLYITYTMFGWICSADRADASQSGYQNGNIWLSISDDLGISWGLRECLTTTSGTVSGNYADPPSRSAGCNCAPATPTAPNPQCPAPCLSEHWSSTAAMVNGMLHLLYVGDLDAGGSYPYFEGNWTRNDIMYLPISGAADLCPEPCDCGGASWGDVDGSGGGLKPLDVSFLVKAVYKAQYAMAIWPNCPLQTGDVNCDCSLTPLDVTIMVLCVYKNQCVICPNPCTL